jgi:hypothetical protein
MEQPPRTTADMYAVACEGFRQLSTNQANGFLAIATIALTAHLKDWWEAEGNDPNDVVSHCPYQRSIRDVANGAKHMNLRKLDKLQGRGGYGAGLYNTGPYGTECFLIETEHGQKDVVSALRETLAWWSMKLGRAAP